MKKLEFPAIDNDKCILCRKCINICPENAIETTWKSSCSKCVKYCSIIDVPCNPLVVVIDHEKCNNCGLCLDVCPRNAITMPTID